MMRNSKPIEFDGFKGYEFETFKINNYNFNYPEFVVIKGIEFDPFETNKLTMADSPQLKIWHGKK